MRYRAGYPHIGRVRCRVCGAVFAHPMATEAELLQFYDRYYDRGNFGDQSYKAQVARQYAEMRATDPEALRSPFYVRPRSGDRILDVGCGLGLSLVYASCVGAECHGTEYDRDAIQFCQGFLPGARIFNGSLLEARYPEASFDIVVFNHVIEHVTQPRSYIRESGRILRPGGTLVVATPNIGNWGHTLYRAMMFMSGRIPSVVDGLEHTVVFTLPLLRRLVEEEGFRVIEHAAEGATEAWTTIIRSTDALRGKTKRFLEKLVPVNQRMICRKP